MRILVLGAGGVGGYFGGRIADAGGDVTFLVRAARAVSLQEKGLSITSPFGDSKIGIKTVTAETINSTYDLVLFCCKSYHLDQAIEDIAPAIDRNTTILPLLNGLKHLESLDQRFGKDRVLGGACHIAATLGEDGEILHLNELHRVLFGERNGGLSERVAKISEEFEAANFDVVGSENIMQTMWDKFTMLCSLAGMTCMMRAGVGDILSTDNGRELNLEIFSECMNVSASQGYPISDNAKNMTIGLLTDSESNMTASMLRDMEQGYKIEADHLIGDMLVRAISADLKTPILRIAYCHLQSYQNRTFGRSSA